MNPTPPPRPTESAIALAQTTLLVATLFLFAALIGIAAIANYFFGGP